MSFSQELKKRRKMRNLSLREASKGSGISPAMLSRFERGIGLMEMSAEKLQSLADFFRWNQRNMLRAMREEAKGAKAKAR